MKKKYAEKEIAAAIVEHLRGLEMTVYQEVDLGGPVADIVAMRGPEIWIVETKTTWSLSLLAQLMDHKRGCRAHRLFAGVPLSRNDYWNRRIFEGFGFGVFAVDCCIGEKFVHLQGSLPPRLTHGIIQSTRASIDNLSEEHKRMAFAGARADEREWSPFSITCRELRNYAKRHPGATLKEAIARIEHHYASERSAVQSLSMWALQGRVNGVVLKKGQDGKLCVWNDDSNDEEKTGME